MNPPSQTVLLSKTHSPCIFWRKVQTAASKARGYKAAKREQRGKLAGDTDGTISGIIHWWAHQMHPYPMNTAGCRWIFKAVSEAWAPGLLFTANLPPPLAWQNECFTGRCSQAPSLCTSWRKQALRGCRRKEQPTAPSQVISRRVLAPCAGAGKEGTWSKKAAKSQFLCWHHLSKKRTCIHRPQCLWFTLTWVRSEPGPGALLQQ